MQLRFDPVTTSDQLLKGFLAARAWPFRLQADVNARWLRGASEGGDFCEGAREEAQVP